MKKIIDWFWDGVMLKDIHDKTTYKLFIFMYSVIFFMTLFVNLLCIPAFISIISSGLNFEKTIMLLTIWSSLVLVTPVLFVVVKNYKKIK